MRLNFTLLLKSFLFILFYFILNFCRAQDEVLIVNNNYTQESLFPCVQNAAGETVNITICTYAEDPTVAAAPPACLTNNLNFYDVIFIFTSSGLINGDFEVVLINYIQNGGSLYFLTDASTYLLGSPPVAMQNTIDNLMTSIGQLTVTITPDMIEVYEVPEVIGPISQTCETMGYLSGSPLTGEGLLTASVVVSNSAGVTHASWDTGFGGKLCFGAEWISSGCGNIFGCDQVAGDLVWSIMDPSPGPIYTPPVVDLGNDTVVLCAASYFLDAGNPDATFLWSDGSNSQSLSIDLPGTYWVEATLNGCSHTDSITIDFASSLDLDLGNDTILCPGADLLLGTPYPELNHLWQDNTSEETLLVTSEGTYHVTVSSDICSAMDSINISFQDIIANFSVTDTSDCVPFNTSFTDLSVVSPGTITEWHWDFGDGGTSDMQNPEYTYLNYGNYEINFTINSDLNCTDNSTLNITGYPNVVADFDYFSSELFAENGIEFTNLSTNSTDWNWNFGDGSSSTEENPNYIYEDPYQNYLVTLFASNDSGCSDSISYLLSALPPPNLLYIPNSFTPNNDGINEALKVIGSPIDYFSLRIFDKNGHLVFESHDISQVWNGSYNGGDYYVPDGIYNYRVVAQFSNKEVIEKFGHISIFR